MNRLDGGFRFHLVRNRHSGFFRADDRPQGSKSDFQHIVIRFLGGDFLQHQPRHAQRAQRLEIRLGGNLEHLVGNTRNQRKQDKSQQEVHNARMPSGKHEDDNRNEHDDEKERGSAPWVKRGVLFCIFDGKRFHVFKRVDALVLRTMILEDTFYFLVAGYQPDIGYEQDQAHAAFYEVGLKGTLSTAFVELQQVREKIRQQHEEADAQDQGDANR